MPFLTTLSCGGTYLCSHPISRTDGDEAKLIVKYRMKLLHVIPGLPDQVSKSDKMNVMI